MRYSHPNTPGAKLNYESRYDNFIGGEFVRPARGAYFENLSPVTGQVFTEVARSTGEDVERALDAAHAARAAWGATAPAARARILDQIRIPHTLMQRWGA